MRPVQGITRCACGAVVGQQAEAGDAVVVGSEVAKFAVQTDAAAACKSGRERCVAIRRGVPVIRQGNLQTAFAVDVDGGRQPARFALIRQRKTQARRGQNRHTQKTQHRAFGDAFVGIEIQAHLVTSEQPRRAARAVRRAAGVSGLRRNGALLTQKVQALRHAACAHAPEKVCGVLKKALELPQLDFHFWAAEQVAVAADLDVAAR